MARKRTTKEPAKDNNDMIFADGIRVFTPHEKAPSFVVAEIVIQPRSFTEWIKKNVDLLTTYKDEKQIKLQLRESKGGTLYIVVNDFKPTNKSVNEPTDDLPF
jgi:hypothetical protein